MKEDLIVQPSDAKLEKFKQTVLSDASAQKEKILEEIKETKAQALHAAEAEISLQIKSYMEKELEKLNNKDKQALSKENFDGKRALLLKRDQILNLVFKEVKEKLGEYLKTDEYKGLLVDKTKQVYKDLGDKDVEIFVRQDHLVYKDELEKLWKGKQCKVSASNSIEYGGIMFSFPQINLIVDETFDSKISQLQRDFIKISGLYFG